MPECVTRHGDGHDASAWLTRLTLEDAGLPGGPFLAVVDAVTVDIEGVGPVRARVEPSGSAVRLHPDERQRSAVLADLAMRAGRSR